MSARRRQGCEPANHRGPVWVRLAVLVLLAMTSATAGFAQEDEFDDAALRLVPIVSDERLEDIQESADGTRLLTHDRGFAPKLWDTATLRVLANLGRHEDPIQSATFSPDGRWIVSRSYLQISLWDAQRARFLGRSALPEGDFFTAHAVSHDGKWMAVGTYLGGVYYGAVGKDLELKKVGEHGARVRDLEFARDNQFFVSAGDDRRIQVRKLSDPKEAATSEPSESPINWIEINPGGTQVLATGIGGQAEVYDAATAKVQHRFEHVIGEKGTYPNTLMAALFVGRASDKILTCRADGTIVLFDPKSGLPLREIKLYTAPVREIRKTRDATKIAAYAVEETQGQPLRIYDIEAQAEVTFKRVPDSFPTAGEFSGKGDAFWLGYMDGALRRHELGSEVIRTERLNPATTIGRIDQMTATGDLMLRLEERGVFGVTSRYLMFSPRNVQEQKILPMLDLPIFSPSGLYRMEIDDSTSSITLFNTKTGKPGRRIVVTMEEYQTLVWTPRDQFALVTSKTGLVEVIDLESAATIARHQRPPGEHRQDHPEPNGTRILSYDVDRRKTRIWDAITGKTITELPGEQAPTDAYTWHADGQSVVVQGATGFVSYRISDGAKNWEIPDPEFTQSGFFHEGHKLFIRAEAEKFILHKADTGEQILSVETTNRAWNNPERWVHPKEKHVLQLTGYDAGLSFNKFGNFLRVYDFENVKLLASIQTSGYITDARYSLDGTRILTSDSVDGLVIWDSVPVNGRLKRLGSVVFMRDGTFLVSDVDGRYDASDPSNVLGATYVYEWTGGLEAIDVSQFKPISYEPGLFAKLMGIDPSPSRALPSLDQLKLYPEVQMVRNARRPSILEVTIRPRDGGGIGRAALKLNGKEIFSETGKDFFLINTEDYQSFLLPASRLPEGQGNLWELTVSNAAGTLVSRPVAIDTGVPETLKAPDVNLFALVVGVGDYVGDRRDLKAPPTDAAAMARALKTVGERLLPGRVQVDQLSTAEGAAHPTRANIMAWFDSVQKKATSSDIILLYLAGHGTSRIGEQAGYFFLTSDADPGEVTPAMIGVSALSADDLKARLTALPASKQVVILDTCHSGAAAESLLQSDRSVGADYARAYEGIKDATGVWLLAGSAADQLSYESSNVDHGLLTYSLLEAIDNVSRNGLREGSGSDLFVDVERWLSYAAGRVESLKNEVGIAGVQRPEFRRSRSVQSFDVGVVNAEARGALGLRPPKPIVIFGSFDQDEEDPAGLEPVLQKNLSESPVFKLWTDISKHPRVFRVSGTYRIEKDQLTVRVALQRFDSELNRKTLESFEVTRPKSELQALATQVRTEIETRLVKLQ